MGDRQRTIIAGLEKCLYATIVFSSGGAAALTKTAHVEGGLLVFKLVLALALFVGFSFQFSDAEARGHCRRGFEHCFNKCLSKGGKGSKTEEAGCSRSCGKKCAGRAGPS
jgi:hypothetical protein